jgi:hypothetical protein
MVRRIRANSTTLERLSSIFQGLAFAIPGLVGILAEHGPLTRLLTGAGIFAVFVLLALVTATEAGERR